MLHLDRQLMSPKHLRSSTWLTQSRIKWTQFPNQVLSNSQANRSKLLTPTKSSKTLHRNTVSPRSSQDSKQSTTSGNSLNQASSNNNSKLKRPKNQRFSRSKTTTSSSTTAIRSSKPSVRKLLASVRCSPSSASLPTNRSC